MTKSQLKVLMKECLSELIEEGAFDKRLSQLTESKFSSMGSSTASSATNSGGVNPKIIEAVNTLTMGRKNQKGLFQELLMETALTSLQTQLETASGLLENSVQVDSPNSIKEQQLVNLAGGNPMRWAKAAFGGKQKV